MNEPNGQTQPAPNRLSPAPMRSPKPTAHAQGGCTGHSLSQRVVALVTGRCSETGKRITAAGL
ncbi:hypothetical protein GCM10007036_18220 [Alsobacter metallidurans]|uniref:Uncharacterized protein n=1 Tax=Alsobacter metallidurans TaxID=340221 RepID=A0A917MJD4_9HYPH|nr:hypothetical protein GCM10007036_18220 [Alsobacter metallidurans]